MVDAKNEINVDRARPDLSICLASTGDVGDHRAFSGTLYHMHNALRNSDLRMDVMPALVEHQLKLAKAVSHVSRWFTRAAPYQEERTARMASRMAAAIKAHLAQKPADVIFSNSSIPLSLLETGRSMVFYADATFTGLRELYPEFKDYPVARIEEGDELERLAIRRADRMIYTSQWAADSAINDYGADPSKVHVVPRGGNLGGPRDKDVLQRIIEERGHERCELLLVGVSWLRKGGDLAVEVLRELERRGIPARLTVVGCKPPAGINSSNIAVIPFLDQGDPRDLQHLIQLFSRSHFLLVPSIGECFGVVYAEAASMALPSFARDCGGVRQAIDDGVSGHVMPFDAPAAQYADRMALLWNDRERYNAFCASAYAHYQQKLNWTVIGDQLAAIIRKAARG